MLAPQVPSFPSDVAVPPHRGAVIGAQPAESLSDYTIAPKPKAKPAGKTKTSNGKSAQSGNGSARKVTGKAPATKAQPGKKPLARTANPQTSAPPKPSPTRQASTRASGRGPHGGDPVAPAASEGAAALAMPDKSPADAIADAAAPVASPLPRESADAEAVPAEPVASPVENPASRDKALPPGGQRALVKQDHGLIGRLVAWLGRLVPRKQRTPLPKARSRLERPPAPVASPVADPAPAPASTAAAVPLASAAEPLALPTDSILSGRMVLKLSEENSRLRRELDALRASVDKGE